MNTQNLTFRTCKPNETTIIEEILTDVMDWLDSIEVEQWDRDHIKWEWLSKFYKPDDFFICYSQDKIAGCMAIVDNDPEFWENSIKGDALYIHKLAVKRDFAGQGISTKMLEFAKQTCIDSKIKLLRLDTHHTRDKLHKLYKDFGFVQVGERVLFDGEYHAILFEMQI